jgi:peptide deformylase
VAVLPIRTYPDPVLRVRCPDVEIFDVELESLAADMVETMHAAPGVGLAAPQVGVTRRIAVVDTTVGEDDHALLVLVNPVVVQQTGDETDFEGCLSIPDFSEKVKRPRSVVVEAQSLDGAPVTLEVEGFLARVICHEIDHLDGVLFVDRLRGLRREKARRHLRRLSQEAEVMP